MKRASTTPENITDTPVGKPDYRSKAPSQAEATSEAPASIELRDEKPPRTIGAIPRWLMCWNLIVTLLFMIGLLLAMTLIAYPYSHGESILEHLLGR
ncbi:MAG: hypothetical protein K2L35_07895 [Muribaculaceae bacterium]|nr:hypothetical protein [Muribaculaceae bacterium]MDE7342971.1 hypothetical protein [Muribaculaceae bacterium]